MESIKNNVLQRTLLNKKFWSFVLVFFFFIPHSYAETGGEENKAEASGEGGGEGKKEGGGAPAGSGADREYAKQKTKLNVLEQKIADVETQIKQALIAQKEGHVIVDEKTKRPVKVSDRVRELHNKLKELIAEYSKERSELQYRYPEEGMVIERRYLPLRARSVEEMEQELGLQADLTRLKAKIDKKYEPFIGPKPTDIPQADKGPESTLKSTDAPGVHEPQKKRLQLIQ